MITRCMLRLRWPLVGATTAALVLAGASGANHLGSLQLGHNNSADAQTALTANLSSPTLRVVNTGTATALRGEAQGGIGVNGVANTGTGQQGQSQTGVGLLGIHADTSGANAGVEGRTSSTNASGAGVLGRNTGGGPGLRSIVNAGAPPIAVNSDAKVTNLNADLLDGLNSSAFLPTGGKAADADRLDGIDSNGFWKVGGNAGTSQPDNFLGTTDAQPLEVRVNNERVLLIRPRTDELNQSAPSVIAGFSLNNGTFGATVAGGGRLFEANVALGPFGSIGGGSANRAEGYSSVVGGGYHNAALGGYSTVGGGVNNVATGSHTFVGGGLFNLASGNYATIPGGSHTTAAGMYSFAAGSQAQAQDDGAFVWADSQQSPITSSAADQYVARAKGHFFLQSDSSLDDQGGFINTSTGAFLSTGGTWTNASSRRLKSGFANVSAERILRKVVALPITSWHYKSEPNVRHIGPVSEDFRRSFGVGENSRSIGTVDADGVALAAIQGLYRKNQALEGQNRRLRAQLKAQNARLTKLERAFAAPSR